MTHRLALIRQVRLLVPFVIHLPYQYIRMYWLSVKYGNGRCTWSSSYQLFALFVCDGDRQPASLSKLEYPIVTYLCSFTLRRGEGTTLYSFFVTQQCFEVVSTSPGRVTLSERIRKLVLGHCEELTVYIWDISLSRCVMH